MGRIDIILPDELERRFREAIARRLGTGRGNLTRVIQQCIDEWIIREELDLVYIIATAIARAKDLIYFDHELTPEHKRRAEDILIQRLEEELPHQVERMARDIVERVKWIV